MTTTLIIFAIYAVIHILSYLGREAAKRREKERQREAAQRRQVETGRMTPPAPVQQPATFQPQFGSAPSSIETLPQPPRVAGKRVDDLASKRREQLEQLRQRREGKRIGSPPSRQPNQPLKSGAPGDLARDQLRARQVDAERRRRADAEANRAKQARIAQQRREAEAAKSRQDEIRKAAAAQQPLHEEGPLTRAGMAQPTAQLASSNPMQAQLVRQLRDRTSLRQLFVIRELLEPPLALRDPAQ